jgi:hypothetical protein
MRKVLGTATAILVVLLSGCGQTERVAGGTSSEVPNALNGLVLDDQGKPVAGAAVRAIPSTAWIDSGLVQDSTTTDASGRWFLSVPTGTWTILAKRSSGWASHEARPDGTVHNDTLRSPVWITGSVGSKFTHTRISLRGTSIYADADTSGAFVLGPLPSGDLRLLLQADSLKLGALVHADPGDVVATGSWISAKWGQENYGLWPDAKVAVIDLSSTGAAVQGDRALFPVPVLLDSVLDVKTVDPIGLRFDNAKGVAYPYTLEWDAATGHALAWVQLDTANGSSAKHFLRVLWGRDIAVPSDMPAVFGSSSSFLAAWHLDSASETSNGLSMHWGGSQLGAGSVDRGRVLSGTDSFYTDHAVTLGGDSSWTISLWVKLTSLPSKQILLAGFKEGPDSSNWGLSVDTLGHALVWSGADTSKPVKDTNGLSLSKWTHLVATFNYASATSHRIGLVVDTVVYDRRSVILPYASTQKLRGGAGLVGSLDEIWLSDTARKGQWSQLEHQTQSTGVPWLRW